MWRGVQGSWLGVWKARGIQKQPDQPDADSDLWLMFRKERFWFFWLVRTGEQKLQCDTASSGDRHQTQEESNHKNGSVSGTSGHQRLRMMPGTWRVQTTAFQADFGINMSPKLPWKILWSAKPSESCLSSGLWVQSPLIPTPRTVRGAQNLVDD